MKYAELKQIHVANLLEYISQMNIQLRKFSFHGCHFSVQTEIAMMIIR